MTDYPWYIEISRCLEILKTHRLDYEDLENGCIAPTIDIFRALERFIDVIKDYNIDHPKLFVSPNGPIHLFFGESYTTFPNLNVVFRPDHVDYCLYTEDTKERATDKPIRLCEIIEIYFHKEDK